MARAVDNATMRPTAATHMTDVLNLTYFGSRINEYSAFVDGVGLYAATGL